jgi:NADPH-dependent 2,4-dienoyl-CoA reductase/sulfur reductase-like enzyme
VADPLRRVVIAGAGLAGLRVAETLRREGFDGTVTLIGADPEPPYDRPPLSKEVLVGTRDPESTYLRPAEALDALDLDLRLGAEVEALDLSSHTVSVAGERVPFDALVLATGSTPRMLTGLADLGSAHVLRTLADARALGSALDGAAHVAIVGAGFIGSEVASSARARGLDVTIVELEETPLGRVLGRRFGEVTAALHRDNGTELRLGVSVAEASESGGRARLVLTDGSGLTADVVVVAVGATPATGWLAGSGLRLDNGVVCGTDLGAGAPGVFAVGDVANWPNALFDDRRMRVEHWSNANDQARHVGRALVHGTAEPYLGSNYVWSNQYGTRAHSSASRPRT